MSRNLQELNISTPNSQYSWIYPEEPSHDIDDNTSPGMTVAKVEYFISCFRETAEPSISSILNFRLNKELEVWSFWPYDCLTEWLLLYCTHAQMAQGESEQPHVCFWELLWMPRNTENSSLVIGDSKCQIGNGQENEEDWVALQKKFKIRECAVVFGWYKAMDITLRATGLKGQQYKLSSQSFEDAALSRWHFLKWTFYTLVRTAIKRNFRLVWEHLTPFLSYVMPVNLCIIYFGGGSSDVFCRRSEILLTKYR